MQFAIDMGLEHKRIKMGMHKEAVYHIQHINAIHSNLKIWIRMFNGVATKYIRNYLKWINTFITEKDTIKTKKFIVQSNIQYNYTMIKDFKTRQEIYV